MKCSPKGRWEVITVLHRGVQENEKGVKGRGAKKKRRVARRRITRDTAKWKAVDARDRTAMGQVSSLLPFVATSQTCGSA